MTLSCLLRKLALLVGLAQEASIRQRQHQTGGRQQHPAFGRPRRIARASANYAPSASSVTRSAAGLARPIAVTPMAMLAALSTGALAKMRVAMVCASRRGSEHRIRRRDGAAAKPFTLSHHASGLHHRS